MAFNPARFLREVRTEIGRVTWPTRKETAITTGLVLAHGQAVRPPSASRTHQDVALSPDGQRCARPAHDVTGSRHPGPPKSRVPVLRP